MAARRWRGMISVVIALVSLSAAGVAQYSCTKAPCIVNKNGWIVGEIRTFAFGEDVKSRVMTELASLGWLECAGQPLARASYPQLFNTMGDTWGSEDGKIDFNLPDLRAQFLRGWNHAGSEPQSAAFSGDPDTASRLAPRTFSAGGKNGNLADNVGSIQPELVGQHEHRTNGYGYQMLHNTEFGNGIGGLYNTGYFDTTSVIGNPQENRPHNVYVMYAIYTGVPSSVAPNTRPVPLKKTTITKR